MSESGYEAASEVDNAFASGSVDELRVRLLTELQLRKSSELAELQTYSSDPLQMLLSARARAPIGSLGDWANNERYVRALRDELHRKSLGYAARDYPPEIMDCPDDDVGVISEAQKFTQVGELLRAVLPDDLSSELKGSHKEVQAFLGDPSPQTAEALARSAPGGLCTALAEATVLLEKLRNDTDASAQRQRSRFTEAHRDQFEIVKAILDNADRPGWCQTETAWEFLRKKDPAFWVVTDLEATISKIDDVRRELLERFLFMDLEEPLYPAALAVEDMRWLVAEVEGRSEGLPGVEPLDSDELEKVLSLLATLWAVHDDDLTGRIQGLLRLVLRAPSTAVESLTLLTRALPEYGDRDPDAVAELCAGI
jgi:hypothetical protein